MSFGLSGSAQGNVRYAVVLDSTEALANLNAFKAAMQGLTQPTQQLVGSMGGVGQAFSEMGSTTATLGADLGEVGTSMEGLVAPTEEVGTSMGTLATNFDALGTSVGTNATELDTFGSSMTAITAPTQEAAANMGDLVGELGPLAGNFKATEGAAKDMIAQTGRIGSTTKKTGAEIAQMGIGVATTATGIIGLVRNFRDLGETQILVDKSTRRVSVTQEALEKATAKLAIAQQKYGVNSKEAANAQRDVEQQQLAAKTAVDIQTRAVKRQSDAWLDLATSGITTVLGVAATGISGMRDFGLTVAGNIPRLKGFATGLLGIEKGAKLSSAGLRGVATAINTIIWPLIGLELFREGLEVNAKAEERLGVTSKSLIDRLKEGDTQFGTSAAEVADYGKEVEDFRSGPLGSLLAMFYDNTLGALGFSEGLKTLAETVVAAKTPVKNTVDLWIDWIAQLRAQGKPLNDVITAMKAYNLTGTEMSAVIAKGDEQFRKVGVGIVTAAEKEKILENQMIKTSSKMIQQSGIWIDMGPSVEGLTGSMLDLANQQKDTTTSTSGLTGAMLELFQETVHWVPSMGKAWADLTDKEKQWMNVTDQSLELIKQHKEEAAELAKEDAILAATFSDLTAAEKLNIDVRTDLLSIANKIRGTITSENASLIDQALAAGASADSIKELGLTTGKSNEEIEAQNETLKHVNITLGRNTNLLMNAKKQHELYIDGVLKGITAANEWAEAMMLDIQAEISQRGQLQNLALSMDQYANLLVFSTSKMQELIKNQRLMTSGHLKDQTAIAMNTKFLKENNLIMAARRVAMLQGTLAANDWVISTIQSTAATKAEHEQLQALITDYGLDLPRSLNFSIEQLHRFMQAEDETRTGTLEIDKAIRQKLNPSLEQFSGILGATNWKDFKSAWKDLDLKKLDVPESMRESLRDLGKDMIHVNKNALEANTGLHALITTAYFGRTKGQKSTIKAILEDVEEIPGSSQIGPFIEELERIRDLPKEARTQALIKFGDAIAAFEEATSSDSPLGSIITPGEAENINRFTAAASQGSEPVNTFAKSINNLSLATQGWQRVRGQANTFTIDPIITKNEDQPQVKEQVTNIVVNNKDAIKAVDVIAKRIQSLSSIQADISLMNKSAIKANDVIAKRIDSLTKLQPDISLQNKNAIKAVDVVAKRIDSLTKLDPEISLDNKKAIRAVDVVAKRINSLSDIDPTVNVTVKTSVTGAGARFVKAQQGMHETLTEDTTIIAHKGERVDIGHLERARSDGGMRSGGGTGDLIVNNVIDMGNDRIIRSFKAKLGTNRYRFGGG